MESLDEHDKDVVLLLGYAVARAQLFEHMLVKLLEVQHFKPDVPFEERWAEISKWVTKTAGWVAHKLDVPEPFAADVSAAVQTRNFVAHHAYTWYVAARAGTGGHAVDDATMLLNRASGTLGLAYNGLAEIVTAARKAHAGLPDDKRLMAIWRNAVPQALEPAFPAPSSA